MSQHLIGWQTDLLLSSSLAVSSWVREGSVSGSSLSSGAITSRRFVLGTPPATSVPPSCRSKPRARLYEGGISTSRGLCLRDWAESSCSSVEPEQEGHLPPCSQAAPSEIPPGDGAGWLGGSVRQGGSTAIFFRVPCPAHSAVGLVCSLGEGV